MGLTHRDVKPGNMLRTSSGEVKLVDFGLVNASGSDSTLTTDNLVMGTPDYVSPEQAVSPRTADARSDIYSLGCSLYHLLAGSVPFSGESMVSKIDSHRYQTPTPISCLPDGLWQIILKMMAKNADERFQTANEVVISLTPYCAETNSFAVSGVDSRRRSDVRARPGWIAFVVVALCGGLAAPLFYSYQDIYGSPSKVARIGEQPDETAKTSPPGIPAGLLELKEIRNFTEGIEKRQWRPRVAFSHDGSLVFAGSNWHPTALLIWNTKDATLKRRIDYAGEGFAFSISPRGNLISYEDNDNLVVANADDFQTRHRLSGLVEHIWCATFDSKEELVAAADTRRNVHIWNCKTGELIRAIKSKTDIRYLAFSPGSKNLLYGGTELGVYSLENDVDIFRSESLTGNCGIWLRDGKHLIVPSYNGIVSLSVPDGEIVRRFDRHQSIITTSCMFTDERHLFCGDADGHIFLYDLETRTVKLRKFGAHQHVMSLAIHPDGKTLLSAGKEDGAVILWQIPDIP
jgi:hypothetical protein